MDSQNNAPPSLHSRLDNNSAPSEGCLKSAHGSQCCLHCNRIKSPSTTKSSTSRDILEWAEIKSALDNSKEVGEKTKLPFPSRFSGKTSNTQTHIVIRSDRGCLSDDEATKTLSTQRSDADSCIQRELFDKKIDEMKEFYNLRISRMSSKLIKAAQNNEILKSHMVQMSKEYTESIKDGQKDNSSLRHIIKSLSQKAPVSDPQLVRRVRELESYAIKLEQRIQQDNMALKEWQTRKIQFEHEIRNRQSAVEENLMKEYQAKIEEMEKTYATEFRVNQDMKTLMDEKNNSEFLVKEMEIKIKCKERKIENIFKFLDETFVGDFNDLVKENHSLKALFLNQCSEAWSYIFNDSTNLSEELKKLDEDCAVVSQSMEAKIKNLRDGRQEMGDYENFYNWKDETGHQSATM